MRPSGGEDKRCTLFGVWRRRRERGRRETFGCRQAKPGLLKPRGRQRLVSLGIDKTRGAPCEACGQVPELSQPCPTLVSRGQRDSGWRRCFVTPEKRRPRAGLCRSGKTLVPGKLRRSQKQAFILFVSKGMQSETSNNRHLPLRKRPRSLVAARPNLCYRYTLLTARCCPANNFAARHGALAARPLSTGQSFINIM